MTTILHLATLLLPSLLMLQINALQPIPSDLFDNGYEDPLTIRRRNNIPYNYQPQWIDEVNCATIDEETCREVDEAYGIEVRKKQKIITDVNEQRRRRRMQAAQQNGDGEHAQNETDASHSEQRSLQDLNPMGSFKVLVLLMRWSDHASVDIVAREDYDRMFNADPSDLGSTVIPTGSVRRYFEVNSYGKLTFEAQVADWRTTDNTESFYVGTNRGVSLDLQQSMVPLLEDLDDNGFDFDTVDGDGDNVIDLVVVLHSGYASEEGGDDCRFNTPSEQRIQSHSSAATSTSLAWRSRSGKRVVQYVFASAFRLRCDANIIRLGVPTHEMFHNFGLRDLYDLDGRFNPESGDIGGIDRFGLMANTAGQKNNKARPGHLSAWSKERLGFIESTVISADGTFMARPVELFGEVFRINLSATEYLLIENRQPIPVDFDENFFGEGGIVIYKVDRAITEPAVGSFQGNTRRGFPGQGDWPGNGNHYGVAVLQADSLSSPGGADGYELEQTLNGGEEEDLWLTSSQILGPGTAETVAANDIYPNTDLYSESGLGVSGVTVTNFRTTPTDGSDRPTYMFDVSGLLDDGSETDSPTARPTQNPTLSPSVATQSPSLNPTPDPTSDPASNPTSDPTDMPTAGLTSAPSTDNPSAVPTASPTMTSPSVRPTLQPTVRLASSTPTGNDPGTSAAPTAALRTSPSSAPSSSLSESPSNPPTPDTRTTPPSASIILSMQPTPSNSKSLLSESPSDQPTASHAPSSVPSSFPTTITEVPATPPTRPPALAPGNAGGEEIIRVFQPLFPPTDSPTRRRSPSPSSKSAGKGKGSKAATRLGTRKTTRRRNSSVSKVATDTNSGMRKGQSHR